MTYCLDDDFLRDLLEIRKNYEDIKKIKFDETPQPYAVSCFFGATNVSKRDRQTHLIIKMLGALSGELLKPSELEKENFLLVKPDAIKKHVDALRVLLVLIFYIKSQVDESYTLLSPSSAKLIQLLDKALKLKEMSIDEETRSVALHAAQKFVNNSKKLDELNEQISSKISESEWRDFSKFINGQCKKIDTKPPTTSLPVTSVIVPPLAWSMKMTGYTTGFILGTIIAKSSESQPVRAFVTTSLSACLYFVMGSSGTLGIMLVAPTYAGKLVETFSGVSCSWILGNTMEYAGKGIGHLIGLPLDLGCKAAYHGFLSLSSILHGKKAHHLTGFNLVSGQRVIEGTEVNLIKADDKTLKKVFADTETPDDKIPTPPIQVTTEGLVIQHPDGEEIKLTMPSDKGSPLLIQNQKQLSMEELKLLLEKLINENGVPLIKTTTDQAEALYPETPGTDETALSTVVDEGHDVVRAQNCTV